MSHHRHTSTLTRHRTPTAALLAHALLALLAILTLVSCSADASFGSARDSEWLSPSRPIAYSDERIELAELYLTQHDLQGASLLYTEALNSQDPVTLGTASAGRGVLGVLLLLGDPPVRRLLINALGATRTDYSAQRLVWAPDGILSWFQRGTRWEDDGPLFLGVRSLVAPLLPWEPERLDSLTAFTQGLDQPVEDAAQELIDLAERSRELELDLARAIQDPSLDYFYLPSQVFHDPSLAIALGAADLSALHGVLSLARGTLHLAMAYQHPWSLERSLTPQETLDTTYLDPLLLRTVARPDQLRLARRAFQDGLDLLAQSISLGLETPSSSLSLVRWDLADRDAARRLRDLLRALSYTLDGPYDIPHLAEPLNLDLSSFFNGQGRTLPQEIPWFDATTGALRDGALHAFALDGTISPPASPDEPYTATVSLPQDLLDVFLDAALHPTLSRFEDAYGVTF